VAAQYPTLRDRLEMKARMLAFVAPRVPAGKDEMRALRTAVDAQWHFEREVEAAFSGQTPPPGVVGVTIGGFALKLNDDARAGRLTRETMCPAAYATLFNAGLLYRGGCANA